VKPVRILRVASGGDGVGTLEDGRTVFVPRTAPGDLVELRDLVLHARFARARLARVLEPGPGRADPPCPHYLRDDCGGCQLQHLSSETQLAARRLMVEDALARIGHLEARVDPVVSAGAALHYRSRISLAVGSGGRVIGYHRLDRPGRLFPLERCELAAPELNRMWHVLVPLRAMLPADATHLVLRLDREGGLHLVVRTGGKQAWTGGRALARRMTEGGVTATIWYQPAEGAPRVVSGASEAFPATVFEQVNPAMAERVRHWAVGQLGEVAGVHVWDLYAGIGETADRLHALGATVESIELDRRAVDLAERRWHLRLGEPDAGQRPVPSGVVRHVGRVEDVISTLRPGGAAIANPPRGGLHPGVVDGLLARRPGRLVYVSCDPATLARDLARLCGPAGRPGFRLTRVQPFDLFPQTSHVETVSVLEAA
jgi:23S rRNA (uracil1939-C5)-methyltransferase